MESNCFSIMNGERKSWQENYWLVLMSIKTLKRNDEKRENECGSIRVTENKTI